MRLQVQKNENPVTVGIFALWCDNCDNDNYIKPISNKGQVGLSVHTRIGLYRIAVFSVTLVTLSQAWGEGNA